LTGLGFEGEKTERHSIATKVRKRIEHGGEDRLWSYPDFRGLPPLAVAAALSRLSKGPNGLLRRVRRGVYYVPKKTRFGESKPELSHVMAHLLRHRGIAYSPTGTAAYNGLGLTTQVSPRITYRVNRPVRSVNR
jgi:predicted transcriptional regulator of viral defense system